MNKPRCSCGRRAFKQFAILKMVDGFVDEFGWVPHCIACGMESQFCRCPSIVQDGRHRQLWLFQRVDPRVKAKARPDP